MTAAKAFLSSPTDTEVRKVPRNHLSSQDCWSWWPPCIITDVAVLSCLLLLPWLAWCWWCCSLAWRKRWLLTRSRLKRSENCKGRFSMWEKEREKGRSTLRERGGEKEYNFMAHQKTYLYTQPGMHFSSHPTATVFVSKQRDIL